MPVWAYFAVAGTCLFVVGIILLLGRGNRVIDQAPKPERPFTDDDEADVQQAVDLANSHWTERDDLAARRAGRGYPRGRV